MSTEENKALFRRVADAINDRQLDHLDTLFAADYVEHDPLPPGWPTGLAAVKQFWAMLLGAFPDFQLTVDTVIAEDDRVVGQMTAEGTQRGEFLGIPPTGRRASWQEIHIGRYAAGKLVEHWGQRQMLQMLQQLGALPAPAPPTPHHRPA